MSDIFASAYKLMSFSHALVSLFLNEDVSTAGGTRSDMEVWCISYFEVPQPSCYLLGWTATEAWPTGQWTSKLTTKPCVKPSAPLCSVLVLLASIKMTYCNCYEYKPTNQVINEPPMTSRGIS